MKITFLGTSGFGITQTRTLPSVLIDDCILFDAGEGTLGSMLKMNVSVSDIKAVFITHFHADHILGLISLLWKDAFFRLKDKSYESFPIYIPEGYRKALLQLISITNSPFNSAGYKLNIIELPILCDSPRRLMLKGKEYRIKWTKTNHKPTCYAYKINNIVFISGDSGPCADFREFAKECKVLIHEASFPSGMELAAHKFNHSTPMDVAELAQKTGVMFAYLYHLPDLDEKKESHFLKETKGIFKNIYVSHDLQTIKI
ncbi:MAG: MBL fold metallo-hydrolase [Candidatus Lokiarchaeota archaeon]|nr:MBL fold metallo-hydrolase [Candidatus Lokiarchaeota archaeon]